MSSVEMQATGNHKEIGIVVLFISAALVFPFQYWFIVSHEEPYPALLMPALAGAGVDEHGDIVAKTADVVFEFDGGVKETLTLRKLFERAPSSHFMEMAKVALLPKPLDPPPSDAWGRTPLSRFVKQHVIPGRTLARLRKWCWSGVEPEIVEWLRQRAVELFPGRHASRVEILWHKDAFIFHGTNLTRIREPKESLKVHL